MRLVRADIPELLIPYEKSLGGIEGIVQLPIENLTRFLAHPGRKAIVFPDYGEITMRQVQGGYGVYDANTCYRYAVTYSLESRHQPYYDQDGLDAVIPEFRFGLDPQDQLFLATLAVGDLFYLSYEAVQPGSVIQRQTDIVIKSAASVLSLL